ESLNPDAPTDSPPRPNYMFVTSQRVVLSTVRMRSDLDTACMNAATGKLSGHYVAWVSQMNQHAVTRLGNHRGWIRPDDLPFADTVADLRLGKLFYPPMTETMTTFATTSAQVATATMPDGSFDGFDCTSLSGLGTIGIGYPDAGTDLWTSSGATLDCSNSLQIYCFE